MYQFSSVAQLCLALCNPMDYSTPGFPVHHQIPELAQTMSTESVMPSNHLILCHPFLLLPSIFPSIRVFSNEPLLPIRWPKYWSFSFSISPSNEFRTDFLQDGLVGSLCSPRDSQESSPTPQFKSINSASLSFLYSSSLTSIHDYRKTILLTRQIFVNNVMSPLISHSFSFKEQASFNFMAAITICSDFGAQNNKLCLSFHCFPIYLS